MDRERNLLYAVALLAPIAQVFTLGAYYYERNVVANATAAVEAAHSCEEYLVSCWSHSTHPHSPSGESKRRHMKVHVPSHQVS